jgi:hypothetical protein
MVYRELERWMTLVTRVLYIQILSGQQTGLTEILRDRSRYFLRDEPTPERKADRFHVGRGIAGPPKPAAGCSRSPATR